MATPKEDNKDSPTIPLGGHFLLPGRYDGVLNVDKPAGPTSARVVGHIKRLLPRGHKVGHAGTLDPFATGVLLVMIGKATKQSATLMGQAKQYSATIRLGATTPTDDCDSPAQPVSNLTLPDELTLSAALAQFVGEQMQRPPAFSAIHVGGRRSYDLARAGQPVELAPRLVRIDAITLLAYRPPDVDVLIDCGKGVYIRSIARDLGEQLNCGGYLTQLRRTRIGDYTAQDAVPLASLDLPTLASRLCVI